MDSGIGLARVDLSHCRGIVGHMEYGDAVALDVRVEKADVNFSVGLDLLTFFDESHIDGRIACQSLAVIGQCLFHGLLNSGVVDLLGVNLGSGGDDAGFGGHLHGDVADVGVALECLGGGGLLGRRLLRRSGRLGLVHLPRRLIGRVFGCVR